MTGPIREALLNLLEELGIEPEEEEHGRLTLARANDMALLVGAYQSALGELVTRIEHKSYKGVTGFLVDDPDWLELRNWAGKKGSGAKGER